ncbi:hypothetical protein K491DRAFT_336006 [Lophiostoma macrostomum CBS 122681]|uniref:Uncharacterized protein n=1 Tax=Lophiostoma macrostomum CBS 122681 TaxID=1314788 RepID=A0A6A6TR95_9PLEO|nr:hypothetical protein K491DRAFT_336006 [Lophiostoma macrostomum CBS 122681]
MQHSDSRHEAPQDVLYMAVCHSKWHSRTVEKNDKRAYCSFYGLRTRGSWKRPDASKSKISKGQAWLPHTHYSSMRPGSLVTDLCRKRQARGILLLWIYTNSHASAEKFYPDVSKTILDCLSRPSCPMYSDTPSNSLLGPPSGFHHARPFSFFRSTAYMHYSRFVSTSNI